MGAFLGRSGFIGETFAAGLKRLVASVSLPVLLFSAFSRLELRASYFTLALIVFASCGVLGAIGILLSRAARLPQPATGCHPSLKMTPGRQV